MILDKLNNRNVKFKLVDSNKNENDEEIYIEIIFNKNLFKDFIMTLLLLNEQNKKYTTPLTIREKQVLKYLSEGRSNEEIAADLKVSVHTAKAHIHNIFYKMKVQDRTQAVVKAIKQRIIEI